jgi:hypothetical protein
MGNVNTSTRNPASDVRASAAWKSIIGIPWLLVAEMI